MDSIEIKSEKNKDNCFLSKLFFWGITIDIFFLPYLPFMAVSISVVLVAGWFLINSQYINIDNEVAFFVVMLFLMALGTTINLFYFGPVRFQTTFSTSIKRFFQFALCFETFFYYKEYFLKYRVEIENIVFVAVVYMSIFAILFKVFPHEYATIKILVNPADNHTRRYLAGIIDYRFNYLWTDPNNVAYLVAGLNVWFMLQKDTSKIKKIVFLLLSFFIVLCTVSNGGLFVYLLILVLVGLQKLKNILFYGINRKNCIIGIIIVSIISALFVKTDFYSIINSNYLASFVERIGYYAGNKTGGRGTDFILALNYLNPIMLFVGTGNEGFANEIGHIYWIGMYGGVAYLIFIWIMFRKLKTQSWSQYLSVIPFFVGFTMNIAIGEYKWMAIYFFILAYTRYGNGEKIYLKENEKY